MLLFISWINFVLLIIRCHVIHQDVTYHLRKNCCVNTVSWKPKEAKIYCNKSDLNYVCFYLKYKKCQIKVETTLRFQRWNNTEISTWNNVEIMSWFQRWNSVGRSTLQQRRDFYVHSTFKSNQNSTSFQCWGQTLFDVGTTLKCLLGTYSQILETINNIHF